MSKLITKDSFIEKASKIHGNKYDYSKTVYIKAKEKVIITCNIHGDFLQTPEVHNQGKGCRKCANIKLKNERISNVKQFIEKSNLIHNNKYSYELVDYNGSFIKVKIKCNNHGIFEQTPDKHLQGKGCPKCSHHISNSEIEIQKLISDLGFKIESRNRKLLNGKELDIYIPSLNKAIEFNGKYWHYSKKYFIPGKHSNKSNLCREKGIKLLHIREDLWLKNKEKMKQVVVKFLDLADLGIIKLKNKK